ncbi:MAG: hypothetical protein IJB30_01220 [Clostridia bacterium]|nr:hypothetical protein [Clostridia bacterium]MBQ4610332.1 hypothetical protein [Clostridia bacterium]MBQ6703686.1 hypothetical protein [Clostridia bacterium]
MLKIKPGYDTVTKTLRLPEDMVRELERIARENRVTFTSVVEQCLQYALDSMGSGEDK